MDNQSLRRVIAIVLICAIVYGLFTQFMMIYTGKISHHNHAMLFIIFLLGLFIKDYIDNQIEKGNNNLLKEHKVIVDFTVFIILLSFYLVMRK